MCYSGVSPRLGAAMMKRAFALLALVNSTGSLATGWSELVTGHARTEGGSEVYALTCAAPAEAQSSACLPPANGYESANPTYFTDARTISDGASAGTFPPPGQGTVLYAGAGGTARISSGQLFVSAFQTYPADNENGELSAHTEASTSASFMDTIHFSDASIDNPVTIRVQLQSFGYYQGGASNLNLAISPADGEGLIADFNYVNNDSVYKTTSGGPSNMYLTGSWTTLGPETFVGTFTLNSPDATIAMRLNTADGDNDFRARISMFSENGYTFTSESGAFLTAAPIPEPGEWAMISAGIAIVGAASRRRNQPKRQSDDRLGVISPQPK